MMLVGRRTAELAVGPHPSALIQETTSIMITIWSSIPGLYCFSRMPFPAMLFYPSAQSISLNEMCGSPIYREPTLGENNRAGGPRGGLPHRTGFLYEPSSKPPREAPALLFSMTA